HPRLRREERLASRVGAERRDRRAGRAGAARAEDCSVVVRAEPRRRARRRVARPAMSGLDQKATAIGLVAAGLLVILSGAEAQDFSPAKNRFGQPDFEGIWQVLDPAPHYDIEPHGARYGVPAGLGIIVDPADGRIPYTAAGLAKRDANRADLSADPIARCYKPGVPHIMYLPFPLQIVQSRNLVTINSEYVHNTRFIYLHRDDHFGEGEIDLWNG